MVPLRGRGTPGQDDSGLIDIRKLLRPVYRKDAGKPKKVPSAGARKSRAVHSPARVEDYLARELRRLVRRWARQVEAILLPEVAAFSKPPREQRTDARRPSTKPLEQAVRSAASRTLSEQAVRSVVESAARRVESHSKDQFRRLGIKPKKEPTLKPLVDGWAKDQAARVKGLADEQASRLAAILEGAGNREASYVARDIADQLGVAESRAEFIARDSIQSLNSKISRHRMEAARVQWYVWTSMADERVRERHEELDGEVFDVDGPGDPDEGHPGEPPNCFPGSVPIVCSNGVEKAFRYRYRGELALLVTDAGVSFESTPNHPVLTSSGWKAAKDVDIGDDVFEVRSKVLLRPEVDREDRYPSIAQVFEACALLGLSATIRGSAMQFHGDGPADQNVDVVDIDRSLLLDDPSLAKLVCEVVFSKPFVRSEAMPSARPLALGLIGIGLPPSCGVSRLGQRLALFARRLGHSNKHGFAPIPKIDPVSFEEVRKRLALREAVSLRERLDRGSLPIELEAFLLREACAAIRRSNRRVHPHRSQLLRERLDANSAARPDGVSHDGGEAFAGLISAGRVAKKGTRIFEGHVYDLQTSPGWYQTSLVNSNCRCVMSPLPSDDTEMDESEEGDS